MDIIAQTPKQVIDDASAKAGISNLSLYHESSVRSNKKLKKKRTVEVDLTQPQMIDPSTGEPNKDV